MTPRARHRLRQATGWTLALAALGGVFAMYTRPGFVVMLVDQVWACF